jgi:hypothetical protein
LEETSYNNQVARFKHPEVCDEWVRQTFEEPDHTEYRMVNGERRTLLYKYIDEVDRRIILVILTEDGELLNRHIDRRAMKRWGRPWINSQQEPISLKCTMIPKPTHFRFGTVAQPAREKKSEWA